MKANNRKILIKNIKLLVYDFDGVMTDNTALIDGAGRESVRVNRSDGLAINIFRRLGIEQVILSAEENNIVSVRANKLKIKAIRGCWDKKTGLTDYCRKNKINLKNVLYIGNEINDIPPMNIAGMKVCPSDANIKVKRIADIVTKARGGEGVIRELAGILKVC